MTPNVLLSMLYVLMNFASAVDLMDFQLNTPLLSPMSPERSLRSLSRDSVQQRIEIQRLSPRTNHNRIPDDCLVKCLEYLCNGHDFSAFRRTSHQWNDLYCRFWSSQSAKFRIMEFDDSEDRDSHRCKYPLVDKLLQGAPCISDLYVDVDFVKAQQYLLRIQRVSKRDVVRGLDTKSKHPFLSLLLWNWDLGQNALVICVFDFYHQSSNVRLIVCSSNQFRRELKKLYPVLRCGLDDIDRIIQRKYIGFLQDHGISKWTVGRQCLSCGCERRMLLMTMSCATLIIFLALESKFRE